MYLLVYMDDPDEAISFVVRIGKLEVEFLDSVLEMCDFSV